MQTSELDFWSGRWNRTNPNEPNKGVTTRCAVQLESNRVRCYPYRWKSVITTSGFRTYLGGITLKTKIYPYIRAGHSQMSPANSSPIKSRIPKAAGTANVRKRLTASQRHRCHQTDRRDTLQCGHSTHGGLLPMGLIPRSTEQLGQADQD